MKSTKLFFFSLLGSISFFSNAQTITITSGTVVSSGSFGGSSSLHAGPLAGNGSSSTGGTNVFLGASSGRVNTSGYANSAMGANAGYSNTTGYENVFAGGNSGYSNVSGNRNTFTGGNTGYYNTADYNNFYGYMSGFNTSTGTENSFYGNQSGVSNTSGDRNAFYGNNSGYATTTGDDNTSLGWGAGANATIGNYNTFVGRSAAANGTTGSTNTYLGALAGLNNITGSSNVFLGYSAGYSETGSDKLYIDNSSTSTPLIWGDFSNNLLKLNGKVGIGGVTTFPTMANTVNVSAYNLFVTGGILTEEVRVNLASGGTWADYVFNKEYDLMSLSELEKFIAKYGHLPNVPSAKQVKEEGIELGSMANIQQEKIEELTLYIIEQNKINEKQGQEIEELKAQIKILLAKTN